MPAHPQLCHFQSYFRVVRDYLWHCLTCAWRLLLSRLSPLSRSVFPPFLSHQKAKPDGCERITSRRLKMPTRLGRNTCWWLLVWKAALFYSLFHFINLNHLELPGSPTPGKSESNPNPNHKRSLRCAACWLELIGPAGRKTMTGRACSHSDWLPFSRKVNKYLAFIGTFTGMLINVHYPLIKWLIK